MGKYRLLIVFFIIGCYPGMYSCSSGKQDEPNRALQLTLKCRLPADCTQSLEYMERDWDCTPRASGVEDGIISQLYECVGK